MNWVSAFNWLTGLEHPVLNVTTVGDGAMTLLSEQRKTENSAQPFPQGYLYRSGTNENEVLYSENIPDDLNYLLTWDTSITYNNAGNRFYSIFRLSSKDIICVWRGELFSSPNRMNPIVYPAGNYENPVVIDMGANPKPTGWLLNSGIDHVHGTGYFIFAEYTRPQHDKAYLWRVTEPYTDPDNWQVVLEHDVPGENNFEHFHTAQYDPYSGVWLATTGDHDSAVFVYMSEDEGLTWTVVAQGSQDFRVLNYIFTSDAVYWASDTAQPEHALFKCGRDGDGKPDFSTTTKLWDLPRGQATYVTCLTNEPYGLLLLDNNENPFADDHDYLKVWWYDFANERMNIVKRIFGTRDVGYGFRCRATTFYPNPNDDRIVCGFDHFQNRMQVLTGDEKTLCLQVKRNSYSFSSPVWK